MRAQVATLMAALGMLASAASAQDTKVVTVGPEYAAGGAQRFWLGDGYRVLWTTPVALPVLDLKNEGGGLTPVRQVGQAQSVGLAMKGGDGRAYTFRSLHKEADRMLPEALRTTLVGAIARDLTSGTHPAAGVIAPVLAEAAGVPHSSPRLVVMPDDPALGEFAKTFANLIGTIEEYPLPAGGGNPGFMGATEIIPSTLMWKKWMEGPGNAFDSQAYLRARVLDLWVDNYDRHRGQWRWMRLPGKDAWQPLPEDPDFVLVHRDGMVALSIRSQVPQYLAFSEKYPGRLDGALLNSAEMDRWILAGTSAAEFEAMARELQARFTDEVIERALRQMPPAWYAVSGAATAKALQTRRTGLVDYLLRVYRYYAKIVDIHATDRHERVSIARGVDGSIEVTVALADGAAGPHFRRTFVTSETDEIRIFLHGGDDRVERTGQPGGPITVRVIAGGGRDVIDDSKSGGTQILARRRNCRREPRTGHPRAGRHLAKPGAGERRAVDRTPKLRAMDRASTGVRLRAGRAGLPGLWLHADGVGIPDLAGEKRPDAAGRPDDWRHGREDRVRRHLPPAGFRTRLSARDVRLRHPELQLFRPGQQQP